MESQEENCTRHFHPGTLAEIRDDYEGEEQEDLGGMFWVYYVIDAWRLECLLLGRGNWKQQVVYCDLGKGKVEGMKVMQD